MLLYSLCSVRLFNGAVSTMHSVMWHVNNSKKIKTTHCKKCGSIHSPSCNQNVNKICLWGQNLYTSHATALLLTLIMQNIHTMIYWSYAIKCIPSRIILVPTEYKARHPQGQSGQFGGEKNLFLLQGFKFQITETAVCSLY